MEDRKATNIIEIIVGQEHSILYDQDITNQSSLMYPAFCTAIDALEGIVAYTDLWNSKQKSDSKRDKQRQDRETDVNRYYAYSNNIIAFCAMRGQGKTSAMLSFSGAVECDHEVWERDSKLYKLTKDHSFYALPPVDPTMLSEGDSVIQLVLGKLFREISALWENPRKANFRAEDFSEQESEKFKVLEDFKACYHGLQHINKQGEQGKNYDDFEKMLEAGDIFRLKKRIHDIVTYFFRLSGCHAEDSFLLIQLDDTDMQMDYAYEILEEVRKYLAMPNVVVLMATCLDQLRALITQRFAAQLHETGDHGTAHHMAAKYLDKLIPASQTVYLPTMRIQRDTDKELLLCVKRDGKEPQTGNLENTIFQLIYQKTGLAFIRHDHYMHNLLPTTLRGLQHLFRLLDRMEIPKKPEAVESFVDDKPEALERYCQDMRTYLQGKYRNLTLFENYFLSDWCSSKIDSEEWGKLKDIDGTALIRRLPHAVQLLNEGGKQEEKEECPVLTGTSKAMKDKSYFVTLIDFLKERAKRCVKEKDFLFVFAMETYFSIQLNKLAVIDQIASMDDVLSKIKSEGRRRDGFLYQFRQLTGCLYHDIAAPKSITVNELEREFAGLTGNLRKGKISKSTEDQSAEILNVFLHALSVEDPTVLGQKTFTQTIRLQEYAVYVCCNLDVLAQILKKTDDFTAADTASPAKYFERLKEELITKKGTLAYPFSDTETLTFYSVIEYLVNGGAKSDRMASAADAAVTH